MLNSMKWSPQYSVLVALLVSFAACAAYIGTRASDGETTWRPGAKHWDRVPVRVYFSDFGGVSGHAIKMWNDAAGCTVLTKTTSRSEADIVVKATDGTPCGVAGAAGMLPDHAGGAYIQGDCAEVHVAYPGGLRQQLVVVAHEIGHLLGLGDDPSGCRIMRGSVERVVACPILLVSDRDGKTLGDRYCSGGTGR